MLQSGVSFSFLTMLVPLQLDSLTGLSASINFPLEKIDYYEGKMIHLLLKLLRTLEDWEVWEVSSIVSEGFSDDSQWDEEEAITRQVKAEATVELSNNNNLFTTDWASIIFCIPLKESVIKCDRRILKSVYISAGTVNLSVEFRWQRTQSVFAVVTCV